MKVKVTIDGKETEVELDDALYMTTEQHESGLKKEVEPLKQQLGGITAKLDKTRRKQLVAELTESMIDAGVKKTMARRLAEVEVSRGVFGFDDESESWAVKDGDSFAIATNATKERLYKGASEFAQEWAKDKANADFLEKQTQDGPGFKKVGTGGGGGAIKSKADFKSETEKVAYITEHGSEAFAALPLK